MVLQLGGVDDHHVIVVSDLRHTLMQAARGQGHDPERERRLRWHLRIHGGEIGPFQRATGRVRVHQQYLLSSLDEDVSQPDR